VRGGRPRLIILHVVDSSIWGAIWVFKAQQSACLPALLFYSANSTECITHLLMVAACWIFRLPRQDQEKKLEKRLLAMGGSN
jgi:hypothetical protein